VRIILLYNSISLLLLQLLWSLRSFLAFGCASIFLLTLLEVPYNILVTLFTQLGRLIGKVTQKYKRCNYSFIPIILRQEGDFFNLWQFWYLKVKDMFITQTCNGAVSWTLWLKNEEREDKYLSFIWYTVNSKTNSVAFSPQANYTDWATATWRNLVPTFADRGVSHGQGGWSPTVVNLFSRSEPLLLFQVASHLSSQGLSGPRSRPTAAQKIW
jgi:hypothetical protein